LKGSQGGPPHAAKPNCNVISQGKCRSYISGGVRYMCGLRERHIVGKTENV